MKNVFVPLALGLTLFTATAFAEPGKMHGGEHAKHRMTEVIESMDLDATRKAAVLAEMEQFHQERRALAEEKRSQMRSLMQEHKARLGDILTEEEMTSIKQATRGEMRKSWRKHQCQDMPESVEAE